MDENAVARTFRRAKPNLLHPPRDDSTVRFRAEWLKRSGETNSTRAARRVTSLRVPAAREPMSRTCRSAACARIAEITASPMPISSAEPTPSSQWFTASADDAANRAVRLPAGAAPSRTRAKPAVGAFSVTPRLFLILAVHCRTADETVNAPIDSGRSRARALLSGGRSVHHLTAARSAPSQRGGDERDPPVSPARVIRPAFVSTPLVEQQIAAQAEAHGLQQETGSRRRHSPTARRQATARPEEVADVAKFLLGSSGRAFTGTPVVMDLGWSAR